MQNDFIEELKKKAQKAEEDAYKKEIKKEYPWLSDDAVREKFFEETLRKTFNPKGGEER